MYRIDIQKIIDDIYFAVQYRVEKEYVMGFINQIMPIILNVIVEAINDKDPDKELPEKIESILKEMEEGNKIKELLFDTILDTAVDALKFFIYSGADERLKYKLKETLSLGIIHYSIEMDLDKTFLDFQEQVMEEQVIEDYQEVSDIPSIETLNDLFDATDQYEYIKSNQPKSIL